MFGTALAQLRFGASVAFGLPFAQWSLDWLIDGLLATRREFGAIGAEGAEMMSGPEMDDEMRRDMHARRFRAQAKRAARDTAYYAHVFDGLGLDPAHLSYEDIGRVPITPKEALRDTPDAFVRRGSRPAFRTTTTGTTGWPTSVMFSDHEMRVYTALNSIAYLTHNQIGPEDVVQLSTSSRATLGNTCFALACQRVGALWMMGGLVEPALSLALLAEKRSIVGKKERVSFLSVYPSYLGELVETGLRLGYRPADFGLERVSVGGEVVTAGLKARARDLFGEVEFIEGYGITEIWPVGGVVCEQGHLHFEPSSGMVEVIGLESSQPAADGEAGTLVATPFPPYRETTVVLRFDTQDVVLPVLGPLTCAMRNLPATSNILGKRRLALRHAEGWTFPRAVMEALEALPDVPLPARFGFCAVPGGVAVEVVAASDAASVRRHIAASLEDAGVALQALTVVTDPTALTHPYPLRCDLRETSFRPTNTQAGWQPVENSPARSAA